MFQKGIEALGVELLPHVGQPEHPVDLGAWDRMLRGLWHLNKFRQPSNAEARREFLAALTDGRAARYEDRFRAYDYASRADFNIRSLRTTNVLRWEYKPGSEVFVVYTDDRTTTPTLWTGLRNKALVVKVNRLWQF